ncbi:hypothetical protein ANO11243_010330 [Dothideomycetidae sp. 11243]|nr:hypothetical protein ANO11243_010330 [fungal sp. No.11243]
MSKLNVLVVGASIAGPATAYWLARAGAKVTVIERFSSLRTGGQAIDIRTAGVTVMRKIPGMEAQVRAKLMPEEGVSFVDAAGRSYGTIRPSGNPDQQTIISEFEILRGNLSEILYGYTKNNKDVTYIFGEEIASMSQSASNSSGPVRVEFANGTKPQDFDLVVACDGAFSRTRASAFGWGAREHVKAINAWAAYFCIQSDLLDGSRIGRGRSAVGGRFVTVGSDPGGFSRIMLINVHGMDKDDRMIPYRQATAQGTDELKRYIAQHYADAGWIVDRVLDEMMDSKDFYSSEFVKVQVPKLSNGRVVLVGDSGYAAPTGNSTSMALAGAYILAGELGKHPGDIEAGLKAYEERIQPLIDDMQKLSPFVFTIMAPQTAWGIWIRNHLFALIAWTGLVEFVSKYLAPGFASTKAFPLPEYEWAN